MTTLLYPAIDVRDGRVVRLQQGDYARETRYADDPFQLASRYVVQGAEWLHLVDLDAARDRHLRSRDELPLAARQLSRGEPAPPCHGLACTLRR